ncbi:uncharacterized protein LOC141907543 isoform X2 [Tubulanus polymorphus]|uniref:uncharacterized protein LOC141907543 isoform X2 n=1 Tax=Tubulanus polymorphus TaxID=672921 RepID=UPI003DA2CAC9
MEYSHMFMKYIFQFLTAETEAPPIFPFDNNSSPADPDHDVLDYPVVTLAKKKRKCEEKRYFIITADDAYANAVAKQNLKEKKEQERIEKRQKRLTTTRPEESNIPGHDDQTQDDDQIPEASMPKIQEINISEGVYIALYQEGNRGRKHLYFGVILEILAFGDVVMVQFLNQPCETKNSFIWPDVDIIEEHPTENIIYDLSPPKVINNRMQLEFPKEEFQNTMDVFATF